MLFRVTVVSDKGPFREINEDNYGIINGNSLQKTNGSFKAKVALFAVSDGMGGGLAGEIASKRTVENLVPLFKDLNSLDGLKSIEMEFESYFRWIHDKILHEGEQNPDRKGMAATLSILWIKKGSYVIGHVGDSRIYKYSSSSLQLLTTDHSKIWNRVVRGELSAEQARTSNEKNVLTQVVGGSSGYALNPQIESGTYKMGDCFLLCTDGFIDGISDEEMSNFLSSPDKTTAEELGHFSLKNSGKDNTTLLLIDTDDDAWGKAINKIS